MLTIVTEFSSFISVGITHSQHLSYRPHGRYLNAIKKFPVAALRSDDISREFMGRLLCYC